MSHGIAVIRRLIDPWINTDLTVFGDSYFSSVEAAHVLGNVGTRFIGAVKTATRGYPMKYFGEKVMKNRRNSSA